MKHKPRVGIAFQGGGFPAGAIGAGVVRYLVERGAFRTYDVAVLSGTSAGALVATVCWGHLLKDTIEDAPQTLEKQWMHFALGVIPDPGVAQLSQLVDSLGRMNPVYRYYADNMLVPFMRYLLKDWILRYIPVDELIAIRDQAARVPGLALGAADVLHGTIKVFTERDFCLEAILSSGSLDEINGITTIAAGPNKGTYCDGAWGTNPPITPLLDYGIDELWYVEVFPKERREVPRTPADRKDRKDELWQNSLVEHELYHIEKVNEWLRAGRLRNDDHKYRLITVKRMPMTLDLPVGAAYVNSPTFIQEMMAYGYEHAAIFLDTSIAGGDGQSVRGNGAKLVEKTV
ncbi:MAG TPA: patatin-like phospholipase family protein [Herpetosiphonaceae bacterium]